MCIFPKGLLDKDFQEGLINIGMFLVLDNFSLYKKDEEMQILEDSLDYMKTGPFGNNRDAVDALLNKVYEQ